MALPPASHPFRKVVNWSSACCAGNTCRVGQLQVRMDEHAARPMAFPSHFLDEIRTRVSLADIIGRRVKLTRRGREWLGLCPFHNEKTPSFTVNEDKGFYHCFGCQAHGSAFDFVMQQEGLSFPEAVEKLAAEAGMQMPVQSPEQAKRERERATLQDAVEVAANWYQSQLKSNAGRWARQYLEARGLSEDTVEEFRLGFAPDSRTALREALLARKLSEQQLVDAGLLIRPEDGGATYDRFRNRVMFPISDSRGRVIAFGGRALGDAPAKYLNSPETTIFQKGRVLFNYAKARATIREQGNVIVAEGYMDIIALHQAGFANAVAPLGTALTENQLALLWRLSPEPCLCFDGDAAGLAAAYRIADKALPLVKAGHSIRFALMPGGHDPDSLIQTHGRDAFREVIEKSEPLSSVVWQSLVKDVRLKSAEDRAALEKKVNECQNSISDLIVKRHYGQELRSRMWDHFRETFGWNNPNKIKSKYKKGEIISIEKKSILSPFSSVVNQWEDLNFPNQEIILVAALLVHPNQVPALIERLVDLSITDSRTSAVFREMLKKVGQGQEEWYGDLDEYLEDRNVYGFKIWVLDTKIALATRCIGKHADEIFMETIVEKIVDFLERVKSLQVEKELFEAELLAGKEDQAFSRIKGIRELSRDIQHDDRAVLKLNQEIQGIRFQKLKERELPKSTAYEESEPMRAIG